MIKFSPDSPPDAPDTLVYVNNLIPTTRGGYKTALGPNSLGTYPAQSGSVLGCANMLKLDGSERFFVGTDTKLFTGASNAWTDVSRSGNYTAGAKKWRFCQYGDVTIAANGIDTLQVSTGGAFANISGSPVAKIVENASPLFVMALDTVAHGKNSWYCSALGDYSDWSPSAATSCAWGNLFDTPGGITGGKSLGPNFIIYKKKAIYLGSYIAPDPLIWTFDLIPGEIGAVSHESIVNAGDFHLFVGPGDFFLFDGTRPRPIGADIKKWFFANALPSKLDQIQSYHDPIEGVAYWFYTSINSASSTTLDNWVAYNYKTGLWGAGALASGLEFVVNRISSPFTSADVISIINSAMDYNPSLAGSSPVYSESMPRLAYFNSAHALTELSNTTTSGGELMTADVGSNAGKYGLLAQVIPTFHIKPTTAICYCYSRDLEAPQPTILGATATATLNSIGRFDLLASGRYHRVRISMSGYGEIAKVTPDIRSQGLY